MIEESVFICGCAPLKVAIYYVETGDKIIRGGVVFASGANMMQ